MISKSSFVFRYGHQFAEFEPCDDSDLTSQIPYGDTCSRFLATQPESRVPLRFTIEDRTSSEIKDYTLSMCLRVLSGSTLLSVINETSRASNNLRYMK